MLGQGSFMAKKRLDILLFEKGLVPSRERAKAAIMEGLVYVNGQKADKAGENVAEDARIEVRSTGKSFVSRGGKKIEKALGYFKIDPSGLVCMDIGASTGGFTDCLLQRGANKVYSIDVGYGQLAWSLRQDPPGQMHGTHQYSLCDFRDVGRNTGAGSH